MPWLVYNDKQGELVTHELEKPTTVIGRKSDVCDVALKDASVSREHAEIRMEANKCTIRDKGSLNHTHVNGKEVQRSPLKHNDLITIGDFSLRFLEKLPTERRPVPIGDEEITLPAGWQSIEKMGSHRLSVVEQDKEPVDKESTPTVLRRRLELLLDMTEITSGLYSVDDIMAKVSAKLFAVMPAERCFLLLREEPGKPLQIRSSHQKDRTRPAPEVPFSRKVLETVVRDRKAILANNVLADTRFERSKSVRDQNILSMITVPLVVGKPARVGSQASVSAQPVARASAPHPPERPGEVLGVLHLDNLTRERAFSQDDLRLVQTIAGQLASALSAVVTYSRLKADCDVLSRQVEEHYRFVGSSEVVQKMLSRARRFALSDAPILLTGETGTGKEILARSIHLWSRRSAKPFVAVDCGLFTKELINSELFGYEKGAFTGANARKIGKLEIASGGTVFFDEIANLDLEIQSNLLRVLQEYEFQRIGGNENIKVDVRIVTATNTDLFTAVEKGTFRRDLLNRLNVCEITVPPLRERKDEIPEFVEFFVERHRGESFAETITLEDGLMGVLMEYDWPGNVRQLENAIRRLIISGDDGVLRAADLPAALKGEGPGDLFEGSDYHTIIKNFKTKLVRKTLAESANKQTDAAKKLGIQQSYLSKIMKNLNLR
ncbi:MAG: sigma 54-interacting transcriptional regulator [bacterium]|nr:sigma 54-interacting transcriptional regulator [bacterium]